MPPLGRARLRPGAMSLPCVNFHTHHPPFPGEIALGAEEAGLDRRLATPMERQMEDFRQSVMDNEQNGRFLTVHCVRALDQILRMKREMRPARPWMLHGFRGKPQQLRSALSAGMYVSFGLRFNEESLRECPLSRLCLETDDTPEPILPLYEAAARIRNMELHKLKEAMLLNGSVLLQKCLLRCTT